MLRLRWPGLKSCFGEIVETQAAQIADLQAIVYGRKPKGGKRSSALKDTQKVTGDAASCRRPKPDDSEVVS
jgi:hypothetical protein